MSWWVRATAVVLAGIGPAIPAAAGPETGDGLRLNQFNLVTRLGIAHGQWHTTLTIDDARLDPAPGGPPIDPAKLDRLRAKVGTTNSTDDCITPRVRGANRIILPGLRIEDYADAEWSATKGKLFIKTTVEGPSGFRSSVGVTGEYATRNMKMNVVTQAANKEGVLTLHVTLRSQFVGQCKLVP